ncbi:MAG TPA: hypothetical protein VGQ42_04790 [Candidatus Dormibacteraeota bacterium]|jgi:hypothetical protein|nr:hypothetical protein [Candidatus Dormibacteraeota bacterium]
MTADSERRISRLRAGLATTVLGAGLASAALIGTALTAAAVVPSGTSCSGSGGEPEIFYVGGSKPSGGATPQCDVIVPSNGVIVPGSTIGVYYNDETAINTSAGLAPTFDIDGAAQPITLKDVGGGAQKHRTSITITVPNNLPAGTHTATVTANDGDQNKHHGGDFGKAVFNFGVSDGSIGITPQSATNAPNQSHVFTVTATAQPYSSNLPVTFGAITTSVSPAPSSQSTTCNAPSGSGNTRTCTITINSTSFGVFTANATVTMTINGQSLTRSTDPAVAPHGTGGTGPATKTYVGGLGGVQGIGSGSPTSGVQGIIGVPSTGGGGGAGDGSAIVLGLVAMGGGAAIGGVVLRRRRHIS